MQQRPLVMVTMRGRLQPRTLRPVPIRLGMVTFTQATTRAMRPMGVSEEEVMWLAPICVQGPSGARFYHS